MGLGVLGRGVGDAAFLADCGADLIVTDLKNKEALQESLIQLSKYENIKFILGEHRIEDFQNRDMILKSAGVPLDSVHISEAKKQGIPIEMSSALFSKIAMQNGVKIIGITGTRGKSTTTHLIYQILMRAYTEHILGDAKIFLGGNIKGVATLPFLSEIKNGDIAVLELDSWQLQGFGEDRISPHISVFTTFLPDHMNYYNNDLHKYLSDKANIFLNQKPSDFFILGEQAKDIILNQYKNDIHSSLSIFGSQNFPDSWNLYIPGEHNRYNAVLSIAAARMLQVPDETIKTAVELFTGVEGRLQLIKEKDGIKIFNDTTSTMPDATIAGLKAVSKNKNVVLLMGGTDKSIDMSTLIKIIPEYVKAVILIPGSGTDKIKSSIESLSIPSHFVSTLEEGFNKSVDIAQHDDVILFSPAFASFGLFNNEYDRGEQFNELVKRF